MSVHIMLDLETWGIKAGCDIRSIGAVVFNPVAGNVGIDCAETIILDYDRWSFYIATDNPIAGVDKDGELFGKYPLTRDPETVAWWNDQLPEAQAAFANPVDLREVCYAFHFWLEALKGTENHENICLWANGPQFDVSILEAVYHAVGLPVPWHYRAPRDFRTITDAAGMSRDDFCKYGEAHNALHDAIAQAMTVCEAYRRLGLQRG